MTERDNQFLQTYKQKLHDYLSIQIKDEELKESLLCELQHKDTMSFDNIDYMEYTYYHRIAIAQLFDEIATYPIFDSIVEKLDLANNIKQHDIDKLLMYLFFCKKTASKIHRTINAHHINDIQKCNIDLLEMILDWECAYLTKDDKKLNAYDTLMLHLEYSNSILPLLKQLNMASSYDVREKYHHIVKDVKTTPFNMDIVLHEIENNWSI